MTHPLESARAETRDRLIRYISAGYADATAIEKVLDEFADTVILEARRRWCDGSQDELGAICDGPSIKDYIILQNGNRRAVVHARWCYECLYQYVSSNPNDKIFSATAFNNV